MAFDSPSLGGYTFENPPKPMTVQWEEVQQLNELADGSFRKRSLGWRVRAVLEWEDGWVRKGDVTGIATVAADASASLTFIPRPTTFPTRSYAVIWTNKFDFSYWDGHFGAYRGTIELVSPSTTSVIGELP